MEELEQALKEEARWRILRTLDAGRSGPPMSESMLLRILGSIEIPLTAKGLRDELVYLEDRGLIHIKNRKASEWHASIGHHGTDIVEYAVDCFPGIARPPR